MQEKTVRNLPETIAFALSSILLIAAPLLYSGKTALALMLLEFLGIALLACVVWFTALRQHFHRPVLLFITVGLGLTALYLLPIPQAQWETLPGRAFYLEVAHWLQQQHIEPRFSLSLIPDETLIAFLSLLPPLALFLAVGGLSNERTQQLVIVFLGIAALEASIGLIQYASNNPTFFFGIPPNGQSAQGTYLNRDHFAALMEMALPIAIGLTLYTLGNHHRHRDENGTSWLTFHQTLIYGSLMLLILLGGIFSRSRAGVFLSIVAVLLSSLTFARHIGGKQSAGITAVFGTIAGGLAVSIGLVPILNRFVTQDPLEDGRWEIFKHSVEGIKTFFPFGSGPGTFPDVYRGFQPIEQMMFINNAHNDYLELLFEMGIAGAFIIAAFVLLYLYGWVKLWGKQWTQLHFIQNAAGIGIFIILLHSFADFNLHTPANMIAFTFLCGLFFRKTESH
jgi:O-antigen ligase